MEGKVASLPEEFVLGSSEYDLCQALANEFRVDTPTLRVEEQVADRREARLDSRGDPSHSSHARSVSGSVVTVTVPFDGDSLVFYLTPSSQRVAAPRGRVDVREGVLELAYGVVRPDAQELRLLVQHDIDYIGFHLDAARGQVDQFNASLPNVVEDRVRRRKAQLLAHRQMMAELGIPLRRREDAPNTHTVPLQRRRPAIQRLPATRPAFTPEWALPDTEYENILSIIQKMAEVMERSPSAFASMREDHLRVHFLVQLNAQYEWDALPEVFNLSGKTDILIRYEGKTVFIAECKIWRGPKSLSQAVDQLFSYLTWRDTKAAILLFNRRRGFSHLLAQIPAVIAGHGSHKQTMPQPHETAFRFRLGRPDDPAREIILTVLAFDVPTRVQPEGNTAPE